MRELSFELGSQEKRKHLARIDNVTEADERNVKTRFGKKLHRLERSCRNSSFLPWFLVKLIADVKLLYEMLCDDSYQIKWKTKAHIIFALGYFISPVDAIPDVIPLIGFMDDAVVVAWVLHLLQAEIQNYKRYLFGEPRSDWRTRRADTVSVHG